MTAGLPALVANPHVMLDLPVHLSTLARAVARK
jgi:hypothetical protein